MIRGFIAKNLSYRLQDLVNRTSILETQQFLNQSQYWESDRIISYQFEKFQKLLHHTVRNIPFYKELFREAKLGLEDIRNPEDVSKIPIITKETVRREREKMILPGLDTRTVVPVVTGGTTGPPLKILRDRQDSSYTWGAFYRWYNWMGIEPGDRITKIWGTPTVLNKSLIQTAKAGLKNFYYNRQFINSFNLNQETLPGVFDRINKFRPLLIRGYLSAMIQLAEYMEQEQLPGIHSPRAMSSTTETLLPSYKALIERSFNTTLYDQYGCGECNSMAFDNGDGNGLYVAMEHCLVEILNGRNEDAGSDEGRIIMTNLDNFAMPFIRYENGDIACRGEKTNQTDINLDVLKRVSGRMADTIVLKDGSRVHGVFFTDILNDLFTHHPEFIHRFQVFQDKPGAIEFRIETKSPLQADYKTIINDALHDFFSEVTITTHPQLEKDKTGKFRYIVSKISDV